MAHRGKAGEFRALKFKARGMPWRQALKEKCVQRLKSTRSSMFAARRGQDFAADGGGGMETAADAGPRAPLPWIAADVLKSEWSTCRRSQGTGSAAVAGAGAAGPEDEDEELMMMIYDEILQELVHEEQMMAAEDERQLELERQAEEAQFATAAAEGVFCPICCKKYLCSDAASIYCVCGGFHLSTPHPASTLHQLKTRLEEVAHHHGLGCLAPPGFAMHSSPQPAPPLFGMQPPPALPQQSLVLHCSHCGAFQVVG